MVSKNEVSGEKEADGKSYDDVVRSSSIIGGSQLVTYVIRLIRIKVVAVLLGPDGVGLIGLFQSAVTLLGTVSDLGVGKSAVRDIAEAHALQDSRRISLTVRVLRKVCWITGALGALLSVAVAKPMSRWVFETDVYAGEIAVLGAVVLVNAISAGQVAILQGMRRLKELAMTSIYSAIAGVVVASVLYFFLREDGIVPALIVIALANLFFSWFAVRNTPLEEIEISWGQVWESSRSFLGLGLAFMWGAMLTAFVALALRGSIAQVLGLALVGAYQAAWGLSGLFATFLLSAMGANFYPRLTGISNDHPTVNRLVGEQIEIGLLLALPGLVATMTLAPLMMVVFYTKEFSEGSQLLVWFAGGILVRVFGWPIGMIQQAKGAVKWLLFSQTFGHSLNLVSCVVFMHFLGLKGIGVGFVVFQVIQIALAYFIAWRLTGFKLAREVQVLMLLSLLALVFSISAVVCLKGVQSNVIGLMITIVVGLLCLRGLVTRLGEGHRLIQILSRLPFGRKIGGFN